MNELHIALTGHRPTKLGGYDLSTPGYEKLQADLEQYIRYRLNDNDVVVCHSGLALGADSLWSRAALNMRHAFPGRVKFYAEVPMMTQSSRWPSKGDREFWDHQVETADDKTVYGVVGQDGSPGYLLNLRNEGMVDHADEVLAIWDGSSSGTGNAVKYAEDTGKPVTRIDPKQYF